MDKATEMGKTSTEGSVQLFLGTSSSTIIRAIGAIILGLFILPGDYGLYVIAFVPSSTLSLAQDWGVGSALTRYCAKYRAANDEIEQRKVIISGLIYEVATGLVLTVMSLLLASFFALTVFNKPTSAPLIAVVSVTILSGSIATGVASIFTGFEHMQLNSYLAVITAIVYSLFAPLLVYFGYGAMGAIIGFTLSAVVQCVISIIFLYVFVLKKISSSKISWSDVARTLKTLLNYGVPLGIGNIVSALGGPVFSFLMAHYISEVMIGNYKIATNFAVLISFVTAPIGTVLFPAFSKLDPRSENNILKTVFASSIKYTNIFLIPVAMAITVLATPLIGTLYGNKWPYAPFFLALSTVFYLLSLSGIRSMGTLLSAVGETKLLMEMAALSLILGIPAAFLLVPQFGIVGIIIGLQVTALPGTFFGLYHIWKHYGTKADFAGSAKILIASALAAAIVYLFLLFLTAPYWVLLVAGSILFLVMYLVSAPLVGAITQSDLNSLRTLFSGLGKVSRLLEIPFEIIQKIIKIKTRNSQADVKNNGA
jgi:stage V sporulation protein B